MSRAAIDRARGFLLRGGLGLLASTWRFREEIPEDCVAAAEGREPVVIAFWHGSMLPVWYRFRKVGASALISASRDGEMLSGFLRSIGYGSIIRGSSSRGGSQALAAAVARLETGSVMITPDGPRGPARQAKPGIVIASKRSGRRLLLVGCTPKRSIRTSSWDRMRVPLPFTTIAIRYCMIDRSSNTGELRVGNNELDRIGLALSALDPIDTDTRRSKR